MSYTVKFSNKAAKEYSKLPKNIQLRIDDKISYLQNLPRGHDTKKLEGTTNQYRTRVGTYRMVYEINDGELIVYVIRIAHRREVY